jgi:hypothetical protein
MPVRLSVVRSLSAWLSTDGHSSGGAVPKPRLLVFIVFGVPHTRLLNGSMSIAACASRVRSRMWPTLAWNCSWLFGITSTLARALNFRSQL